MTIEPAREEHKRTLFAIHEQCFRNHIEEIWGWDDTWQWRYFCKEWQEAEWRVLQDNDTIIGYLCWTINTDHLYLYNISLTPEYQGRSFGGSAMDYIENIAAKRNIGIKLSTMRTNLRVVKFYQNRAYKILEEVETGLRLSKNYGQLVSPKTKADWEDYHSIREKILFLNRGKEGIYQRDYPDEFLDNHFPKLYKVDGISIGTIRIDMLDNEVGFRLVAIKEGQQGNGHGAKMKKAAEKFAIQRHSTNQSLRFSVNSAKDALGFYQKLGYALDPKADDNDPENPKMAKTIEPIILRTLNNTSQHIETIAEWLYTKWGQHLPERSIATSIAALKQLPNESGLPTTVIATKNDQVIGVARLVESDLDTRQDLSPWLASVYLPIERRESGTGSLLCREIVKIAKEMGHTTLYLFTPDRMTFYKRLGWISIGKDTEHNQEVTIMKFNL